MAARLSSHRRRNGSQLGWISPSHPAEDRKCDVSDSDTVWGRQGDSNPRGCSFAPAAALWPFPSHLPAYWISAPPNPPERGWAKESRECRTHPGSASPWAPQQQGLGGTLICHGENFSRQPQAAVFGRRFGNFLTPGGGVEKIHARAIRARPAPRPGAQTSRRQRAFHRFVFARFCHNSAAVFRLWQLWQRLCRLPLSQNFSQSPLWSSTWSTSVASVR